MPLANTKEFIKQNKDKKFYKITNEDENHNGVQFETGLNVDTVLFNPSGERMSGGIYFTDFENFPYWTSYDDSLCWVREITFPIDCQIYIETRNYKADKLILGERMSFCDFYNSFSEEEIIAHMKMNGMLLQYIDNQTFDICAAACAQNGRALGDVKYYEYASKLYMIAVSQNGYAIHYIPKEDQTEELCIAACTNDGFALQFIETQTVKMCIAALKNDITSFALFTKPMKSIFAEFLIKNEKELACIL